MVCGQDLRGIFTAAEGVDIQRLGHGLAQADGVNLRLEAAHAGALAQDEGVAVVAVGTEDVGKH